MEKIVLEVPKEILISLKETKEEFSKHLLMVAAAKLYQMGKLSSGRAAQLAGIARIEFLRRLGDYGVPVFDMTEEELESDLKNAETYSNI